MLGIVGTVPDLEFPLTHGRVRMEGNHLILNGRSIPVRRGTPALIAAALKASESLGSPEIYAFLVGDIGRGDGSRKLYRFFTEHLPEFDFKVLTFHYIQPDVDWHNRVLLAIDAMKKRPFLIADAGFMYAAKMSGRASAYDFFTPDIGELAFLADELAPHPFYTRGFILHQNARVPELIDRAYRHRNSARHLIVKGECDRIVCESKILETVSSPSIEAMEAIGGTGDTLTGLLTVLCGSNFEPLLAATLASAVNRRTGALADADPSTQISELIVKIPQALAFLLQAHLKVSANKGI